MGENLASKEQLDMLDEYVTLRVETRRIITRLKSLNNNPITTHVGRERSIAITKLEEAVHRIEECANGHTIK